MNGWYVAAVFAAGVWVGVVAGIVIAALASANRRGGQVDLTGLRET